MAAPTGSTTCTIKLHHSVTGEVRKVTIAQPPVFKALKEAIREHFKLKPRVCRLTYVDEEGDAVTVFNDASLAEVLLSAGGRIPRITVTPLDGKSTRLILLIGGRCRRSDGAIAWSGAKILSMFQRNSGMRSATPLLVAHRVVGEHAIRAAYWLWY